jgi:Tetratricopeptide repeat
MNMRQSIALVVAILSAAVANAAPTLPTSDEIVGHYIKAIGGQAACDAIQSVLIRGTYTEHGEKSPAQLARMRPFYKLVGDPLKRSSEFEEGYDGSAWEFYGDPGIVLRTVGPASAAARHGFYTLGNLVDYRKQGSTLTLIGIAKIDGHDAYQLRVRMMDGFEQDEFVDTTTWLIVADRKVAKVHAFGADVASETRWSDYHRVNGVLFAFRNVEAEIKSGKQLNEFQAETMDVNLPLDPSMFAPPALNRTPVQHLMDQLFLEREEMDAALWTCYGFRTAYAQVDTDIPMQVIGYQILKMGDKSSAVALLERNAADYPTSSSAAFGLGRAYRTVGRMDDAKREFERALSLDPNNNRAKSALSELSQTG